MPHSAGGAGGASHEVGTYVTAAMTTKRHRGSPRSAGQTGFGRARCRRIVRSPSKWMCVGTTTGNSRSCRGDEVTERVGGDEVAPFVFAVDRGVVWADEHRGS